MTEPSTDQFGIPLSSLRLLVSPLRLMSAALWGIVQHRAVKHYGLLEDFITAVHDNIPGVISHSERLHVFLGLRAKMVLEMCNRDDMSCKQHIESLLIKMDDLIMLQEDETSQSKMRASLCDFTKLVHSMLEDPLERDLFYQKPLSSEFEFTFDSNLQMLVGKLLVTLENLLPTPSLDQTCLWLGLCPSILKECEDILHQPEPLSNLLQQHKHKSTFSTELYSNDYFPSFYDSAEQQVESDTIQYRGTDTKGDVTDGTEDCAPSVEVTLSFDDDLCSETFESFNLLREHSASGCSGDSYEDDTIQLNFNSIANTLSVKNDSKPNMESENIVCLLCSQVYTHKTLLEHQRVCVVRYEKEKRTAAQSLIAPPNSRSSPIFKERSKRSSQRKTCAKCEETFTSCVEFTSHMRVHSEECRIDLNNYEHNFHQENVYKENKTLMDNDLTEMNDTPKEYKECVVRLRRLPRCRDTTADNSNVDSSEFGQNLDEHQNVNQCYILIEPCNINSNVTGNNSKTNPVLQLGESENNTSTKSHSLKCTLCELTFSNIFLLKRHYFALHRVKGSYPCPSCKRRFVRLCDMVKHHQNQRLFQCDTCQWCFTKLNFCKVHKIRLNTCATPNVYETCGQSCLNSGVLKHDQKAHMIKRESTVCTICNKTFSTKYCLRLHMNRHTGGFSCSICNKVFHQKTFLKRHMDQHNGEEPYLCEVCGKGFPTPATLKIHMVKHKDERPFHCDQCDKSFKRKRVLKVHIRTMHLNLREHVCPVCSKAYKYSGSLKEHMIKHTGVYPHTCFLCGMSFERLTYLKKHQEKKCLYISL